MFLKRQQWSITNYVLVTEAAMLVIAKEYSIAGKSLLRILVIVSAVVGIVIIWILQFSMTKFRNRLAHTYETYFSSEEHEKMHLNTTRDQPLRREVFIPITLTLACVTGGYVVFTLIK
jgi:hypothetical protein